MSKNTKWVQPDQIDHESSVQIQKLCAELKIDKLVLEILHKRGISERSKVISFLGPQLADLPGPFLMSGMDHAVQILSEGLQNNQEVLVWGDYDADGVTGTALLVDFLTGHGWDVRHHIPNRLREGYGLNIAGLEQYAAEMRSETKILVTVDNGISAHEEITRARELGFRVIVSDHHQPPQSPVSADAILNPKQEQCNFPDKNLAGVGVAFYLVMGLRSHLTSIGFYHSQTPPNLKILLDLVALGTVADLVPLTGVNRIMVKAGLEVIRKGERPGIRALLDKAGLLDTRIRGEDISFALAPRLNAAGRLGQPLVALSLLLANNTARARLLSKKLEQLNSTRKDLGESVQINALKSQTGQAEDRAVVMACGDFHVGVIGIAASRLVDQFNKPTIIFSEQLDRQGEKRLLVGSGRSVPGIDLHQALTECSEWLLRFGGHSMAAGMTIDAGNYASFTIALSDAIGRQASHASPIRSVTIDAEITVGNLFVIERLQDLQLLEPHGQGNPQPIFRDPNVTVRQLRTVGANNEHLQLTLDRKNNSQPLRGIGFRLGRRCDEIVTGDEASMVYAPTLNRFRGKETWDVRAEDIKVSEQPPVLSE
ncbi:MAG: single-stranded-DNA-specific exonuclease RecJ [Desulfobulbaceae bacterium]|uniref:Single-stranded-DNA-specific exonuclease RecJ n=1 Tax=Candidatus Desulfatifera sulfidica TaxID=2841691 RepID=A0A8J6N9A9_9BACT|nr:single-stranded-DNA-specific exonuclease RecJ [Candidatus Desulfatifera sulfidica]